MKLLSTAHEDLVFQRSVKQIRALWRILEKNTFP